MTIVQAQPGCWSLDRDTVELLGEWDMATELVLDDLLAAVCTIPEVTIDLCRVGFMDSTTLQALRRLPNAHLADVPPRLARLLIILGT